MTLQAHCGGHNNRHNRATTRGQGNPLPTSTNLCRSVDARQILCWGCLLGLLAGCGNGPAPAPTTTAPPDSAEANPAPQQPVDTGTQTTDPNDPKSKTKWIGDIPYDVFYDQPLVVASDNTSLAPVVGNTPSVDPPVDMPPNSPSDSTPTAPATGSPSSGPDWQQLASADVLHEEVTRLRNALTTNLNTLATYNRNIETIANDGASVAALAAVVEVHPDDVSWKEKAKYVRDLGYQIYMKADGTGRGPFDATKEPFEQIVAMLNGGPPPDMESEDKVPMADIADRSELMKRVKKSFDFLRAEINTEARFKESPEDIIREAAVLGSFGGIIATESYDSADQEKYRQFVRDFMQANIDVAVAAQADDFSKFEEARNRIQKACDACHGEYAFGDEGF